MVKSITASLLSSLKTYMCTPRSIIALIIVILIIWKNVTPVYALSDAIGFRTNPLLLTFIVNDPVNQLMLMMGAIILFADAPFANSNQMLVLLRSGRIPWITGKICFIAIMSAIYWLVANIAVLLFLLPCATFATDGWGSVVHTLAATNAAVQFDFPFSVDSYIVQTTSPLQAMLLTSGMEIISTIILGLTIMVVNLATSIRAGLGAAIFWVLLDLLVVNLLPFSMYIVSVASHGRLSIFTNRMDFMPSLDQTACFDFIAIAVLSVISIVLFCKKDVRVRHDL